MTPDSQFDENFEPSRGKVGRIVGGEFPGPITIRSKMRDPGPEDDLLITTRDLRMNEAMLFTQHEIQVRHGQHRGRGRRMEIKLLEEESSSASGMKIAGVQSLEIFEQVRLEMHLGDFNPLQPAQRDSMAQVRSRRAIQLTAYVPDADAAAWADGPALQPTKRSVYAQPTKPASESPTKQRHVVGAASSPLEITCAGSFHLDLTTFTATFHQRVHAQQLNLTGQSDQLTCNELRLRFAMGDKRRPVAIDPRHDPNIAQRQKEALRRLQPWRLEALGSPVKIDSPARGVVARGRSLLFDFGKRQVSLEGQPASIVRGGSYVEAPLIRYEHPQQEAEAAIGRMWVAGPGRLRAAARKDRPEEIVEARWSGVPGVDFPVQLIRDDRGEPILSVVGRPQFAATGSGRLTADRLAIAFRETAADGEEGPAIELNGDDQRALLPERIDATGRVEVESPRLSAATKTLTIWMLDQLSPTADGATVNVASASRGSQAGSPSLATASSKEEADPSRYRLTAKQAQIEVLLTGRNAVPTTLACEGAVDFRELNPRQDALPLAVRGERLRVDNLETEAVKLTIHGAAAGAESQGASALATIAARGLTLHARDAHLDQGKNRMWADGKGEAHLRSKRDFLGQQTNAATDLHLSWHGGWVFDGRRITIRDHVFGEGPHDWVRTNELIATLTRPMTFGRSADTSDIEVAQVECRGGVTLDHRTVDQRGQVSQEQAELESLAIDQRSGAISGVGPGWIRSVRLTDGSNPLESLAPGNAPVESQGSARLALLRVHFQGGVVGNLKSRQIEFQRRVRAVYGPVIAWQQDLPHEGQGPLPADTAMLTCNRLQVAEDPMARRSAPSVAPNGIAGLNGKLGPLEMIARGGVRLEGASKDGGAFNAQASQASYTQSKELFVLQGDSLTRATLWIQKSPGEGTLKHTSGKVSYWRRTGIVQTENFGATGFTPTAQRPGAAAR